jgi:DNA-binding XRE family transcriptional regulator
MRQNKQMEVAVVSVEQLHQEFEWMKEQLKKEILLDVEKLGSKELLTRQQLADYLSVSKQTIINWSKEGIIKPKFIGNRVYSGLKPMNKIAFINQIQKNQESLNLSIQEIFKNVDLYRLKINKAYNNKFINDSIYNFKLVVLNDMNILIEEVEKANELLLFYKRKFIDKTKNKHTIWIGENTFANQALNEIKKQIVIIKSAKNDFNTLSVKLNQ